MGGGYNARNSSSKAIAPSRGCDRPSFLSNGLSGPPTGFFGHSILLMHVKQIISCGRRCANHTKPRGKNENTFVRPLLCKVNQVFGTGGTAVSASRCASARYVRVLSSLRSIKYISTHTLTRTYIKTRSTTAQEECLAFHDQQAIESISTITVYVHATIICHDSLLERGCTCLNR